MLDRMQKLTYPLRHGTSETLRKEATPSYDIASRLNGLSFDGASFASNPIYNAASQIESLSVGSQVTETYTFDTKTGLLATQKVTRISDSATFLDLKYNYTLTNDSQNNGAKTGQLTGTTDLSNQARNRAFEYDKLGRLKKVKGGSGAFHTPDWWQDYTYDRYGNRTGVTKTGGGSNIPLDGLASLGASATSNRITSANFEYDPAGNQTKAVVNDAGTVQQYRYDAAGRLAQVLNDSGATLASHSYGASNQRLMSVEGGVTTYYGWDGGHVIAEYEASGTNGLLWKTGYVYLGGRLLATMNEGANGGPRFHHPDRLGTNIVTDQANGELVTKQMGMPYGTQQTNGAFGGDNSWQHSSKNNPSKKRFTSYDRSNATGLDYAVNRFYSAAQGRFTQVDPIEMSAASLEEPQTLNLYSYCGNDPINHVDPDGLFWGKLFGWVGKVLKWTAIAITVAIGVLTLIPAPWAGTALGKLLVFFSKHKTLSAILGIGGAAGGFITPGINGSAGVGGLNSFVNNDPPEQSWWDSIDPNTLQNISDLIAGWGDTLSLGITRKIRQAGGYDRAVNPCNEWYTYGEAVGMAHGFAMGGGVGIRNALAVGGVRGGRLASLGRGAKRFFHDPRAYKSVRDQYWGYMGGAGSKSLHHWMIPQRAGRVNAGWNLLVLPRRFNSWMNGQGISRFAEMGIRAGIPGMLAGGAVRGGQWGLEKQEWRSPCGGK
jgi:RHS repeat-associated protein